MGPKIVLHPNRLREYRLSQRPKPWTQGRLIYELERVGAAMGVAVASRPSLKVQVSRWENGHHPVSDDYRRLFRHIYRATDTELGFAGKPVDEKMSSSLTPVSFHTSWVDSFESAVKDWDVDVERRSLLKGATFLATASTSPALQWLLGQSEVIAREDGATSVGMPHVQGIREMTATFRRLDNRYGGGHSRDAVVRYLSREVAPLVQRGRYDAKTGAALLSATSEMVQQAGWMTYDAGSHRLGQHYMTQALRLARAAGDETLGAEILAGLSHQASYLRDGATAVDLARAAQQTARAHGLDALLAEAAVMEAHGHACAGNEAACSRALSDAEMALDRADRSADPQWIGYFDEAYLSAKFGHCFKELRQPATTKRFALRSLDMDNSYVRGRAFNLALLSTAHAQAGEVEAACSVGADAVALVREMDSVRANEYIRALRRELTPYEMSPAVVNFDQAAGDLLAQPA
jgi:hypothetical protein